MYLYISHCVSCAHSTWIHRFSMCHSEIHIYHCICMNISSRFSAPLSVIAKPSHRFGVHIDLQSDSHTSLKEEFVVGKPTACVGHIWQHLWQLSFCAFFWIKVFTLFNFQIIFKRVISIFVQQKHGIIENEKHLWDIIFFDMCESNWVLKQYMAYRWHWINIYSILGCKMT